MKQEHAPEQRVTARHAVPVVLSVMGVSPADTTPADARHIAQHARC
jgi:hypothetical protein